MSLVMGRGEADVGETNDADGGSNVGLIERWVERLLSGCGRLLSPAGARAKLLILTYHRVMAGRDRLLPDEPTVQEFDAQMAALSRQCSVLPLAEAVAGLRAGRLPSYSVCVTFDDGYANNATLALPVLRRYRVPATFFVATGFLDGGIMWNDEIIEAVRATRRDRIDLPVGGSETLALDTPEHRRDAIGCLIRAIRHLAPADRRRAVENVVRALDVAPPVDLMLSSAQVRELKHAGMEIGGHTVSHPILARLDRQAARAEIREGKERLEEIVGEPIRLFAYPNGRPGIDYLPEHVDMVADAGFVAAVSTRWALADRESSMLELPRVAVWDRTGLRTGLRLLRSLALGRRPRFGLGA